MDFVCFSLCLDQGIGESFPSMMMLMASNGIVCCLLLSSPHMAINNPVSWLLHPCISSIVHSFVDCEAHTFVYGNISLCINKLN